jgi:nucleoside-diphosphate-sugar epimerase
MAFARFISQLSAGRQLTIFGDGQQIRDFTFVDDAVRGTIFAGLRGTPGGMYNIGGGHPVVLLDALTLLGEILERPIDILTLPPVPGDVRATGADGTRAREEIGFVPSVDLKHGLRAQVKAATKAGAKARRKARRWYQDLGGAAHAPESSDNL